MSDLRTLGAMIEASRSATKAAFQTVIDALSMRAETWRQMQSEAYLASKPYREQRCRAMAVEVERIILIVKGMRDA